MRTIWILGMVGLMGCVGDASASFGGESVDVGGGAGDGSGGEFNLPRGVGGASSSSSSSSSTGAGGSGGEATSTTGTSTESTTEPVSECAVAERGAACSEGGGHLCDGAGVCVEFIGVICQVTSTGKIYRCGDGTPYPYSIITTVVCHGGVGEWPYAPPGQPCVVSLPGDMNGITL